jgi:hypothetical protein
MEITNYEYKTEPYQHQQEVLETSAYKNLYALFLEMGLGKSKILLDNLAILFKQDEVSGAVIVAPKGVLNNWSENEIARHMPEDRD